MEETARKQIEQFLNPEMLDYYQKMAVSSILKVLAALLVFLIGKFIARFLSNSFEKALEKAKVDPTLRHFLGNMSYYVCMTVVILAALGQLGIQTTSFLAVLGSAGLAVGLALQGSLSNFAAGVLLILFRPFQVGEYIEGGGIGGTVEEIQLFVTRMKTPDNKAVFVPNSKLMGDSIVNYSRNATRRCDMVIGVSYDDDVDEVKALLLEILSKEERVLKEPAPLVGLNEFGDSSVNFILRPWVKTSDFLATKLDLHMEIKKRFDEKDISIPYPQQDVYLHKVEGQ